MVHALILIAAIAATPPTALPRHTTVSVSAHHLDLSRMQDRQRLIDRALEQARRACPTGKRRPCYVEVTVDGASKDELDRLYRDYLAR